MKRIAAITMLRDDEVFLRKWIAWYGGQLGRENLYVFLDGKDQSVPDFCQGVRVEAVDRVEGNVRQGDKGRIDFLSEVAHHLFTDGTPHGDAKGAVPYDIVIGTDVDEFLVPDPALGMSLPEFLEQVPAGRRACISSLGIDVGQKLGEEAPLDFSRPLLAQRSYAKLSTRYSKASVLLRPASSDSSVSPASPDSSVSPAPLQWGSGFHRVRGHNFHIVKDLYLFHFGSADENRIRQRMEKTDLLSKGWGRHFNKRMKTITLVTRKKACEWERAVPLARTIQNWVRPPYAWNKPAMFEANVVVRIPERFSAVL